MFPTAGSYPLRSLSPLSADSRTPAAGFVHVHCGVLLAGGGTAYSLREGYEVGGGVSSTPPSSQEVCGRLLAAILA